MDAGSSVAMKLLLLSRDDRGRLKRTPWLGTSLRVAVLVDLAFAGRLHDDLVEYSMLTDPIGFPPVDELLAAIERRRDRPLAWWIGRGHPSRHLPNSRGFRR